jgi:putative nucleotidyltransferase with HDIG domain
MKPLTAKLSQEASTDQPSVQKKYYDDGYGAAGCIFVAKDTGRILLAHRNAEEDPHQGYVNEPDEWATWGGKTEHGESAKDAVVREVEEETGYDGEYKLAFLWTYEDKDKVFRYHNFLAIVQTEFLPQRTWENDRGKWVEWGEWPHPMHFGLKALLQHAGEKIHRVVTLIKRKKAGIVREMDTPPAIVQPSNATANYNITNAYIVATTLWGEARGEGDKGMQAVMNVIMNRVQGNFKRTKGVVLAPKQFSMWNSINNAEETAMAASRKYKDDKSWQQAIRIVDLAADGKLPDITGGATFYFNPKKVIPSWAKTMVKTASIGNHDFYKPRKMVKKKVPAVIREMIESQDPNQSVLFKKGLVDDGVWEYELKSPKSYLRYRHEPDTKIFYLDNIGTPNQGDKNKGYSKALLETFFQLISGQGGVLDPGTYTTSGNAYIKHVVERLSKQYGVRLVKGRDPIHESVSPELKSWFGNSKVVDKHGDPLIVWKGMRWKDDTGTPITHIQRQEEFPAFNKSEPGIKGIAGFFTSDQTVANKFCFGPNTETKPFYLKIENPFVIDMKGGKAGDAQFDKQGQPFRDAMRGGKYDGAIILNTSDEGNVFVIKDPRQVKLATNKTFGTDKEFAKESAVDKSEERGKLSEAYGDPGDHVIFGGVFYPERVVANIVKSPDSYFGHTHEHGPTRWIYYQGMKTVFWHHYPPAVPEWEVIVKEWLEKRGYEVDKQTDKEQYYKIMQWYQKKGLLKEGVRTDYINRQLQALEAEWDRLDSQGTGFDRQQQIQIEIEKLRIEKTKWDKLRGAVNENGDEPLSDREESWLQKWVLSNVIRDKDGTPIMHRIWFKNVFNPFLRKMGWVIATKVDDNGNVLGYIVRKHRTKLLMEAITDEQAKAAVAFLKKMVTEGPFKGQVHLAGGPVRDMIMGKTPKDLDLSIVSDTIWGALKFTSWLANQMGNFKGPSGPPPTFAKHIQVDDYGAPKFTPYNNDAAFVDAIERYDAYYAQYSNPVIFPKFGTAKLNLAGTFNGVSLDGVEVEAVSARKEDYEPGNRKPIRVRPGTLRDDALRRDFRCNSLLMDLTTDNIFDVTGKGIEDIKNRVLITTSDPEVIFKEDPLRMMRAVRFMVQKGFNISPETESNIKKNASWLKHISRERVRDEIDKILVTKDPGAAFRKMNELGLLKYVATEFQQMIGMTQNVHHKDDVFDHTMAVLANTNPELVRRRIALFHDIGKLVTREVTPTGVHFIGHEMEGPAVAEKIMMDLKYPKVDIDAVKLGISHHMKLKHGGDDAVNLSDKSLRKFKIAVGHYLEHILDVIHADNTAHASASAMPNQVAAVRKRLDTLDIKEVDKPTLPITGNDLIAIGIKPGPVMGKILSAVTDAWYENPSITKDQAMQIAQQTYGKP